MFLDIVHHLSFLNCAVELYCFSTRSTTIAHKRFTLKCRVHATSFYLKTMLGMNDNSVPLTAEQWEVLE
jgi:hypothetical protein